MKLSSVLLLVACALFASSALAIDNGGEKTLLLSYYRFLLAQEVAAQTERMTEQLSEERAAQAREGLDGWFGEAMETVRDGLEESFGEQGRDRFEQFVAAYTEAEAGSDADYLAALAQAVGIAAQDYSTLRSGILSDRLADDVRNASGFLGELQTWIDLCGKETDTPSFDMWLDRDTAKAAPKAVANPLAAAEAGWEAPPPQMPAAGNPLDTFSQARRDRRDRALNEAQAGMQQIAAERHAAEQEYAARKMAEAQADADAMRAHAQKLAAAEQEALDQRKNSWGNRLKRIAGGTISAALGAFTGGVGAEAGRRAADEIFR
jgi:hypothetical protein